MATEGGVGMGLNGLSFSQVGFLRDFRPPSPDLGAKHLRLLLWTQGRHSSGSHQAPRTLLFPIPRVVAGLSPVLWLLLNEDTKGALAKSTDSSLGPPGA